MGACNPVSTSNNSRVGLTWNRVFILTYPIREFGLSVHFRAALAPPLPDASLYLTYGCVRREPASLDWPRRKYVIAVIAHKAAGRKVRIAAPLELPRYIPYVFVLCLVCSPFGVESVSEPVFTSVQPNLLVACAEILI